MPRLIVLNGPPAVGKSTLARRFAEDHPFALAVDIDGVRRMIGGWRDDPVRAGLLARSITLTMAREHLGAGHDVVLPQYLGNPQFLRQAEAVAREVGAEFHEIVLMDDRDTVVRRFTERTQRGKLPAHVDAGWLVDQVGGADALFAMYDRLLLVLAGRPQAVLVHCPEGAEDEVYGQILTHVGG